MKERIKNLLATGMKPGDVASVVGCTPAYVIQLWNDPDFQSSTKELAIANTKEKTEEDHLDTRYQNLEHKIINNIENELGNAELPQLVRALEVVGKRQSERRKEKLPAPVNPGSTQVFITQIALPAHALQHVAPVMQVNEKNEIVSIDSKPLAPMSSTGVKNIFQQIKDKRDQALIAQVVQQAALQEI